MSNNRGASAFYLVCYPTGGLADTLQIIALGIVLAAQTGRELVISKKASQIHGNHIDALFDFRSHESITVEDRMSAKTAPKLSKPDARNQLGLEPGGGKNHLSKALGQLKLLRRERTVHLWGGVGVVKAVEVFSYLPVHDSIVRDFRRSLDRLGDEFAAVHIRNTDYRTDYKSVLEKVARLEPHRSIFLATDSPIVRDWARSRFGSRLIGLERAGFMDESPLHKVRTVGSKIDSEQLAREAFLDLLILGSAVRLYIAPTLGLINGTRFKYSGFSLLAADLHASEAFSSFLKGFTDKVTSVDSRRARRIITGGMIGRMLWKQRLAVARLFGHP